MISGSAAEPTVTLPPIVRFLRRVGRRLQSFYTPQTISAPIALRLRPAGKRRDNMKPGQGAHGWHTRAAPQQLRAGAPRPLVPRPLADRTGERGTGAKPGGTTPNGWGSTHGHGREEVHG